MSVTAAAPYGPVATKAGSGGLAELTDELFAAAIERAQRAELRAKRILKEVLIEGAHFGNPLDREGKPSYSHPILYLAGAEKLISMFRLAFFAIGPDREDLILPPQLDFVGGIIDPGFVSSTVYRGISMASGAEVGEHAANCNSKERRFRTPDDQAWRYTDAREVHNECIQIARKRCKVHLVRGALGLTPWLATEEEMEAARRRQTDTSTNDRSTP